jgi:hypothetical protein
MSVSIEGNGPGRVIGVYGADPVLRLCGITPPDPPAEPMDPREREYFVRVGDAFLAMRRRYTRNSGRRGARCAANSWRTAPSVTAPLP